MDDPTIFLLFLNLKIQIFWLLSIDFDRKTTLRKLKQNPGFVGASLAPRAPNYPPEKFTLTSVH
jgi:hypothetical protein